MDIRKSIANDRNLESAIVATEKLQDGFKTHMKRQEEYAKLRNEREKATFSMMMLMNPEALTNIRKEFFAREDSITLDEFIYIIQKHLVMGHREEEEFTMETPEQREFGINMYELFKDIDVNGDGQLEWQEFTAFTVEKANLLNKRAKLASITHYYDSTAELDASASYRHRNDIAKFVNLPSLGQFAMLEDHKNAIYLFNSRKGALKQAIVTDSAPIAIESILDRDKETIVTSGADMTLSTYVLDDPNPKRRYSVLSSWGTPGVQMALAYARDSRVLYSGATNGSIYAWDIGQRNMINTMAGGHSDIVMSLIVLQKLDNIASASLDKTLGIWDSHTSQEILRLHGHRKGVFDVAYNPSYRLMFSCGFEHDACVWSPFVKNLVFRLKGHHASLVGVQCVENTPELITADTSGIFKLWDVRNFQCVQSFTMNAASLGEGGGHGAMKLNSFFHTKLPSTNPFQKEEDSRIYAASKMLFSFDQARVVHEATTDYTNIHFVAWIDTASTIITASERNVIVWDALMGSKMYTHTDICEDEISACCLDDRRRKIVIGEITGTIGVYNSSNGQLMKTVHRPERSVVIALQYNDAGKRFIAGYGNGLICVYDENVLEECHLIRCFEEFNRHSEMLALRFCAQNLTVVTAEASSNIARLWSYDSGKCDVELHVGFEEDNSIVAVTVLDPYPIVVTSDTTGNIILWGSRGVRWQGLRIAGFLNQHPPYCEQEVRERVVRVEENTNSSNNSNSNDKKKAHNAEEDEDDTEDDAHRLTQYLRVWPAAHLRQQDPDSDLDKVLHKQITRQMAMLDNQKAPATRVRGLRASFNPLAEAFQVDPYIAATSKLTAEELYRQAEEKWGKISPAQSMAFAKDEKLLFVGDDTGHVRCYDIRDVLEDVKAEQLLKDPLYCNRILGLCRAKKRSDLSALPPVPDEFEFHHHLTATGNLGSMRNSMMNSSFANNNSSAIAQLIATAAASSINTPSAPGSPNHGGRPGSPHNHQMKRQASTIGLLNRANSSAGGTGVGAPGSANNGLTAANMQNASSRTLSPNGRPLTAGSRAGTANTQDSSRAQTRHGSMGASKADEFDYHASLYLVGQPGNAMSYLGVKFRWGLSGHSDRVMSMTVMAGRGLVTSAADRLVKMWSMEGDYLGNLLQSVPIGVRSRSWDLNLDVETIIAKEQEELNVIIEQAKAVAADPDKPDIRTMDFSGMELGAESAEFSQSVLRQRIEKTAKILGLDFPERGAGKKTNYDDTKEANSEDDKAKRKKKGKRVKDEDEEQDNNETGKKHGGANPSSQNPSLAHEESFSLQSSIDLVDGLSSIISAAAHSQASKNSKEDMQSTIKGINQSGNGKKNDHKNRDDRSVASNKSHFDALREIKSTESAVDYEMKNKSMSYLQQRRKANKLAVIARSFEEKTEEKNGIRLNLTVGKQGPPSSFAVSAHNNNSSDNNNNGDGDNNSTTGGGGDGASSIHNNNKDDHGENHHVSEEYMQLTRDDASANSAMYTLDTMSKHGKRAMKQQQQQQQQQSMSATSLILTRAGKAHVSQNMDIHATNTPNKNNNNNNNNSRQGSPSNNGANHRRASATSSSSSAAANNNSNKHPAQSKLKEALQLVQERGPRTISMMKSCRKYTAFAALEEAIHAPVAPGRVTTQLSPAELAQIRQERERKHVDLLNDVVPTIYSNNGHPQPKPHNANNHHHNNNNNNNVPSSNRVRRLDSLFHAHDILQFGEEVMYQKANNNNSAANNNSKGRKASLIDANSSNANSGSNDQLVPAMMMIKQMSGNQSLSSSVMADDLSVNSGDLSPRHHQHTNNNSSNNMENGDNKNGLLRRELSMASRSMDGTETNSIDENY